MDSRSNSRSPQVFLSSPAVGVRKIKRKRKRKAKTINYIVRSEGGLLVTEALDTEGSAPVREALTTEGSAPISSKRSKKKKKKKKIASGQVKDEQPRVDSRQTEIKTKPPTVEASEVKRGGQVALNTVGLLKARSPWLRKDNVCLGVLQENSVLHYVGCVEVRVLAGLVHCNGYILRPGPSYHTLYCPRGFPFLPLSPLDRHTQDEEFDSYLVPFRDRSLLHFHSSSTSSSTVNEGSECKGCGCVFLDIGAEDVRTLNAILRGAWQAVSGLVILRPVENSLVPLINYWTSPNSLLAVPGQVIQGFRAITGEHSNNQLHLPAHYQEVAWELAVTPGVKVLVCGAGNSGKSTLCRFLINYLLNRYDSVSYLECDPGQPEFTVPEVLSLHTITTPIFGPSYTHLRKPYMAYYYGSTSPQSDPEYYISILKALHTHFMEGVRSCDHATPLVINTCGWTQNMGVQVFLDVVRSLTPSHIVRTVPHPVENIPDELPALTPDFLNSAPGLFKVAEVTPYTEQEVTPGVTDNDVTMYGSSDDESSDEYSSSSSSSDNDSDKFDQSGSFSSDNQLQSDNPIKRKRLKMSRARYAIYSGRSKRYRAGKISLEQYLKSGWIDSPPYKVFYLRAKPVGAVAKSSQLMRKLRYIAYFSGLFPLVDDVARQYDLPDPHGNMLCYAPPLEVLNSQSLYAINGKTVALGRVDSKELEAGSHDLPRFLKSDTPLIEFIGLGVVRGVDVGHRLLYLTSPECDSSHSLTRINVIALGNPDPVDSCWPQTTERPYMVPGYQSLLGLFSWKTT